MKKEYTAPEVEIIKFSADKPLMDMEPKGTHEGGGPGADYGSDQL